MSSTFFNKNIEDLNRYSTLELNEVIKYRESEIEKWRTIMTLAEVGLQNQGHLTLDAFNKICESRDANCVVAIAGMASAYEWSFVKGDDGWTVTKNEGFL